MGPARLALVAIMACAELAFAARLILALMRTNIAAWCSTNLGPLVRQAFRGCGKADDAEFNADPDARSKAEALLGERTVRFTRTLIFSAAIVFCLRTLMIIVEVMNAGFAASFNDGALVVIVCVQALCVSGSCFPQLVGRNTLLIWHWLLMSSLIAFVSPWCTGEVALRYPFYGISMHMCSIMFGMVGRGASPTFFSNAALAGSVVSNVAYHDAGATQHAFITECVAYSFKVALICSIHAMMRHGTQQEVLVSMDNCHGLAMSSLLDLICDAVVDLDDSLTMSEHCPKLGNLLMHRPGRSLSGALLADFTTEEAGRESFESHVRRNTEGQDGVSLPGMFTGSMRDSIGNHFGVVFFHAPYRTITGDTHHLIGIQEKDADASWGHRERGAQGAEQQAPSPLDVGRVLLPEAELREGIARRVGRHRGPRSQGSGGSTSSSASADRGGGHAITVDVFATDGLMIRGADEAFHTSLGLDGGTQRFLDVVSDAAVGTSLAE